MPDVFTKAQRSRIMAAVRGKDTAPELFVRRLVHRMGYRYRLHDRSLPGCPDLVFPARGVVILVHGCFWHQHVCQRRRGRRMPASNRGYWRVKLQRNAQRDRRDARRLRRLGWRIIVVWECQATRARLPQLERRLRRMLGE